MNIAQYTPLALRTAKHLPYSKTLEHAGMGIASEVGELITSIKANTIYGKPLDYANVIEEGGDILWFTVYAALNFGLAISPEELIWSGSKTVNLNRLSLELSTAAGLASSHCSRQIANLQFVWYNRELILSNLISILVTTNSILQICDGCTSLVDNAYPLFPKAAEANIEKLRKRYPDAYSDAGAIARADKQP